MSQDSFDQARKRPLRVSVSLRPTVYERLQDLSVDEGRSLSNLCAHLIEQALNQFGKSS